MGVEREEFAATQSGRSCRVAALRQVTATRPMMFGELRENPTSRWLRRTLSIRRNLAETYSARVITTIEILKVIASDCGMTIGIFFKPDVSRLIFLAVEVLQHVRAVGRFKSTCANNFTNPEPRSVRTRWSSP